jgi:hypothetical protein
MAWLGRWLFHITALTSLLLCLGIAGAWARSNEIAERWLFSERPVRWDFMSVSGAIRSSRVEGPDDDEDWTGSSTFSYIRYEPRHSDNTGIRLNPLMLGDDDSQLDDDARTQGFAGWGFVICPTPIMSPAPPRSYSTLFVIPYWFPLLLTAIPPVIWLHPIGRLRRRSRLRLNRCSNCGYALTGNMSGICPECGAAASTVSTPPGTSLPAARAS